MPWWISQNNHVTLVDRDGGSWRTSQRSPRSAARCATKLSFDPPLPGVSLVLTAHAGSPTCCATCSARAWSGARGGGSRLALRADAALSPPVRHRTPASASAGAAPGDGESLTVGMRARDLESGSSTSKSGLLPDGRARRRAGRTWSPRSYWVRNWSRCSPATRRWGRPCWSRSPSRRGSAAAATLWSSTCRSTRRR